MTSEIKIQTNRQNAQHSTGPTTPEGRTAVSQNSVTHGLRARNVVLLTENRAEFDQLAADLVSEWHPLTHTESDLVEQLAVNKWKLARLEAVETQASMQCSLIQLALQDPDAYRTDHGTIRFPDTVVKRETDAERSLTRVSQHIARVERAYFRALNTLVRLQQIRLKRFPLQTGYGSEPVAVSAVKVAAAGGSTTCAAPKLNPAKHRRFGGAFLHESGLPDSV